MKVSVVFGVCARLWLVAALIAGIGSLVEPAWASGTTGSRIELGRAAASSRGGSGDVIAEQQSSMPTSPPAKCYAYDGLPDAASPTPSAHSSVGGWGGSGYAALIGRSRAPVAKYDAPQSLRVSRNGEATNSGPDASDLKEKESAIADALGESTRDVKDGIHDLKRGIPKGAPVKNPDVVVDTKTGEVYPKAKDGTLGDSIGNLLDALANRPSTGRGGRRK